MIDYKKAQFSIFDVGFMVFLFVSLNLLLVPVFTNSFYVPSSTENLDQILLYLSENSTFHSNVFAEDLSTSSTILNWNGTEQFLNQIFTPGSYEFRISNFTTSKIIFSCTPSYSLSFRSMIIFDAPNYESREIILGVCS
jgi:hypothetical protein